jgi:hypothetical protein
MSGVPERNFDKRAADALVPRLRGLILRLREAASSEAAVAARDHLAAAGRSNGSAEAADAAGRTTADIGAVLEAINALGVILRDPATGLCDFPSTRDGIQVYLCWKLDEDAVAWWHRRDTGVAGRRPL